MSRKAKISLVLGLILTVGGLGYARVYMRLRAGTGMTEHFAGAVLGYSTELAINGGRAQVQVSQWNMDFDLACVKLHEAYFKGGRGTFSCGEGMAFGLFTDSKQVTRIVAIKLPARAMVFRIDQTEAEYKRSLNPPDESKISVTAPYPGSRPTLYASNPDTGTELEVSSATAQPGEVMSFIASGIANNGWAPLLEPGESDYESDRDSRMKLFVRGQDICCILVAPASDPGESILTLFHKTNTD